jgi:hypothetical protein
MVNDDGWPWTLARARKLASFNGGARYQTLPFTTYHNNKHCTIPATRVLGFPPPSSLLDEQPDLIPSVAGEQTCRTTTP